MNFLLFSFLGKILDDTGLVRQFWIFYPETERFWSVNPWSVITIQIIGSLYVVTATNFGQPYWSVMDSILNQNDKHYTDPDEILVRKPEKNSWHVKVQRLGLAVHTLQCGTLYRVI